MNSKMNDFSYWKQKYESDELEEFNSNPFGLLWLKLKSITRNELMTEFLNINNIPLNSKKLNDKFNELFALFSKDIDHSTLMVEKFIKQRSKHELSNFNTEEINSELYKLRYFDWGGDYKNALDKFLVDKYIKVYKNYDELIIKIDNEINRAVYDYILCSWYNHWSSILIENIFKQHPNVLPTVGKIKKVDFFINDIPFDLKVTYLPSNYIETKRKEKGLKSELTYLKQQAKIANISYSPNARSNDIYYEIVEKMRSRKDEVCSDTLEVLKNERIIILNDTIRRPKDLIKNLYEEQGEMRFDSSNRLFLVLVDREDFDNSWKLKRNLEILIPSINDYLNNFNKKKMNDLIVKFKYKNKLTDFSALSDIIFIIK